MKGRSPLVISVADPVLRIEGRRPSALCRRAALLSLARAHGGDGASRPGAGAPDAPRLVVPARPASEAHAWRARVEAAQEEARAALRVPFNRPGTWDPQ